MAILINKESINFGTTTIFSEVEDTIRITNTFPLPYQVEIYGNDEFQIYYPDNAEWTNTSYVILSQDEYIDLPVRFRPLIIGNKELEIQFIYFEGTDSATFSGTAIMKLFSEIPYTDNHEEIAESRILNQYK